MNGHTDHEARYQVKGTKLVFKARLKGKPRTLVMYRTGKEQNCTMLEVKGYKDKTLRLRPTNQEPEKAELVEK